MQTRPCWVEIRTRSLEENYRYLTSIVAARAELLAIVKANAYGHSLALCAPAVVRAGARWLGVTSVEEGIEARALCPNLGNAARVLVIGGVFPGQGAEVLRHGLTAVAWEPWQLDELEKAARAAGARSASVPVHLEIDTGMSRQGVGLDGLAEVLARFRAGSPLLLEGVMTHLFAADEADGAVTREQLARLDEARRTRDVAAVDEALAALTHCAESGKGNLLDLAVVAARRRATLGEISSALERVWGRYQAVTRTISGVYSAESKMDETFQKARQMADEFAAAEGRRPRMLVAKMGQDGHDRGSKVIATAFADMGFDVDIGPLFQTPREVARHAAENDVHVLGISSLAAGHNTLVPQVIEELKKLGREDILVIVGGVIPPQDYDFLYKSGVAGIFGPGTVIPLAALEILKTLSASPVERA